MNRISINEPCHENWASMTPTDQGAFCGKCQIDVVDFSGKSAQEIKLILEENAGKHLCGRFKKDQLADLNYSYIEWETQSPQVFQSKFLYACLLVFGMTLFSCNAQEEMTLGQVTVTNIQPDNSKQKIENPDSLKNSVNESNQKEDYRHIKGKVAYNYNEEIKPDPTVNENLFIKGDIAYIPDDTLKNESVEEDSILSGECLKGAENEILPESIVQQINTGTFDFFDVQIYPNPTGSDATISIEIHEKDVYHIEVFSMNGQKISDLFSGELLQGKSIHRIDLSIFENGTYLIRISSLKQAETYKLVRID